MNTQLIRKGTKERVIALVVCFLVTISAIAGDTAAVSNQTEVAKIKSEIAKRGTGEKARVKITTRDNKSVRGYLTEIGDSSFVLVSKDSNAPRTLAYSDVTKVSGPGLSTRTKVGIGVGAFAVGVGITATVILAKCGAYCR
jgi:hypothetical protein